MSAPGKRPLHHTNACKAYKGAGKREKNRDRRMARIARGFRSAEVHVHPEKRRKHVHEDACVIEYTVIDGESRRVMHRSAHGTPTAIPRALRFEDVAFCATHHAWEPRVMAVSVPHR